MGDVVEGGRGPEPGTGRSDPTGVDLRTDIPHSARMYDYYLGGKDNFPADREAAEQVLAAFPGMRVTARQNRYFLQRVTRLLAEERGVRQFLDIGTGIPTSPNLHEIAQQAAPESRVVYVDNDPLVLTHARALFASDPRGRTAFVDADLLRPDTILAAPELAATLDLSQPVGLSLFAIMHFVPDEADPYGIVGQLLEVLPAGSYLALSHATTDFLPAAAAEAAVDSYRRRGIPFQPRGRAETQAFFDGLDILDPGVVVGHRWRPDATSDGVTDAQVGGYVGVGRKP